MQARLRALTIATFLLSFNLVLFELLLTRLFAVVLFAQFAHLALALALLGISVGAILQHLWPQLIPDEGLERRLAWIVLLQGVFTLLAVIATIEFPVTVQFDQPPVTYQERSHIKDDLLDPAWFVALLPVLSVPFSIAGLAFAGIFQRRKAHIGQLYGADLIGGAVAAVVFIPVLGSFAGPDAVFVVTLGAGVAGLLLVSPKVDKVLGGLSATMVALSGVALVTGLVSEVLTVKYTAGYSDENVDYALWTPLTRIAVHTDEKRGTYMLLDNTSASEVFLDGSAAPRVRRLVNRGLVHDLHKSDQKDARVAILAASAGGEVAIAQAEGWTHIDAIDIAGDIMHIVADRWPDNAHNPYARDGVVPIASDGRAAILHASGNYRIIQMVHANLWSSAGLLSNAWSPSLLETKEAFATYLDRLDEDGTVSFGRGGGTKVIARAAAQALRERGVQEPWRHMAYAAGSSTVLLVKPRPFTDAEADVLRKAIKRYRRVDLILDPSKEPDGKVRKLLLEGAVMTDDRPYLDDPELVSTHLESAMQTMQGEKDRPLAAVYRSIVIQTAFALVAGALFIGLPLLWRGRSASAGLKGVGPGILYVAGLGYGYLAVETVLIHELVLFVGHPTYAITVVILAMLLASGIGSVVVGRWAEDTLLTRLRVALLTVVVLGAVQAFVVPPLLTSLALGLPTAVRMGLTFVLLFPLGFVMGMPFPLALRLLRPEASGVVPWAWAINGWMSVMASLMTVVISRMYGYSTAFGVALVAYVLALALAGTLPRIRNS